MRARTSASVIPQNSLNQPNKVRPAVHANGLRQHRLFHAGRLADQ